MPKPLREEFISTRKNPSKELSVCGEVPFCFSWKLTTSTLSFEILMNVFFFPYLEADNSGREKDDDDNEDDDDNDDDNDHEDDDKDKDDREQA